MAILHHRRKAFRSVESNWLLSGLLHYYKLDSDAVDAHGSVDGTATNVSRNTTTYKAGTASGDFNGSTSYISLGNNVHTNSEMADFSISFRMRLDALNVGRPIDFESKIVIQVNVDGSVEFRIFASGSYTTITTSASEISTWTRYNIVATRNSTESELYINNISKGTYTSAHSPDFDWHSREWRIGSFFGGGWNWVDGLIDEVAIWDRGISASDVTTLQTTFYSSFTS